MASGFSRASGKTSGRAFSQVSSRTSGCSKISSRTYGFSKTYGSSRTSGFTIIEVALVLAIAGLIFLVVFLALPALQNSQKDTARRQDVGRVVSALQQYEADHNGDLSSLGGGDGRWYSTETHDGIMSAGFVQYVGVLSQPVAYIVIWSDSNNWDLYASIGPRSLKNDEVTNGDYDIGVALGHACSDFGSQVSGGSAGSSSSDAAVWTLLTNGTNYCVDM